MVTNGPAPLLLYKELWQIIETPPSPRRPGNPFLLLRISRESDLFVSESLDRFVR